MLAHKMKFTLDDCPIVSQSWPRGSGLHSTGTNLRNHGGDELLFFGIHVVAGGPVCLGQHLYGPQPQLLRLRMQLPRRADAAVVFQHAEQTDVAAP